MLGVIGARSAALVLRMLAVPSHAPLPWTAATGALHSNAFPNSPRHTSERLYFVNELAIVGAPDLLAGTRRPEAVETGFAKDMRAVADDRAFEWDLEADGANQVFEHDICVAIVDADLWGRYPFVGLGTGLEVLLIIGHADEYDRLFVCLFGPTVYLTSRVEQSGVMSMPVRHSLRPSVWYLFVAI